MDITPHFPPGMHPIRRYGEGKFTMADQHMEGHVLLLPGQWQHWAVDPTLPLTPESLQALLPFSRDIDLLIIGYGTTHHALPMHVAQWLQPLNIVAEMMTTGAACRTYNILLNEGRRVAAALVAI